MDWVACQAPLSVHWILQLSKNTKVGCQFLHLYSQKPNAMCTTIIPTLPMRKFEAGRNLPKVTRRGNVGNRIQTQAGRLQSPNY